MSNRDRLKFIESMEKNRQDRENQRWLQFQRRTSERLKREEETHAAVLAARQRH
jgi:hypothetical protein